MRTNTQSRYETIKTKLRARTELAAWIDQFDCNFFITANFNCETSERSARAALRRWHASVDRELLGPKWHKKPLEHRTLFFAFPEHPNSNRHFHIMLRTNKPIRFEDAAERNWIKVVPSGSIDIALVDEFRERIATTAYSTKDLWKYDLMEQFIVSSEFSALT